ncbi:carboxypeptidase B-like [Clytia hemisphaerica]|uniref:Peptidase M14 domain-containing protein n=1 Tax=Clytia hemisphaerica TaxID=252671 RepID=A0A7M6DMD9_9CNID
MKRFLVSVLCLVLLIQNVESQRKNKSIKKVMLLRVTPTNEQQLDFLTSLKTYKGDLKIQLWRHPDEVDRHVDVWISPKSIDKFKKLSGALNMTYEVLTKNIFDEWDKEYSMNNIEDFDMVYQKYDEIVGELKRLASVYSDIMELQSIGKSYEKNDIYSVHISLNRSDSREIIYLNCGSHAREFLSVSSCKYVIRKILFDSKYDDKIKDLLHNFDIVMTPLLNPDGYIFAHNKKLKLNRLWRKSRSPTSDRTCYGVDLNRNFDHRWGGYGGSGDPCDNIYSGPRPFSEQETLSLARYLYKLRRRLVSYMDVHVFGQLWMSPWGYSSTTPKHAAIHEAMLKQIKANLFKEQNIVYEVGQSAVVLYQTSGDSIDWVYGRLGVVHSYGVELRPNLTVRRGFRYHSNFTKPTGEDLLVGITTISNELSRERNERMGAML